MWWWCTDRPYSCRSRRQSRRMIDSRKLRLLTTTKGKTYRPAEQKTGWHLLYRKEPEFATCKRSFDNPLNPPGRSRLTCTSSFRRYLTGGASHLLRRNRRNKGLA